MKRRFTILTAALALLVSLTIPMGVWGQTTIDVTLSSGTFNNNVITWTCADGNITIQQLKGSGQTNPNSSYVSAPRVYKQNILSFVGTNGYTITNIGIKYDGSYYGITKYAGTEISNNNVDNSTALNPTWSTTAAGTHTIATVSSDGLSEIYVQNGHSSDNGSTQLRITKLTITYKVSGSVTATTVTINTSGLTNTDVYTSTTAGSLSATVKENTNNTIISGATVTWSSSDTDVATIDNNGAVTLIAVGTTTITASYAGGNGYGSSSATYELTVTSSEPYVQPTTIGIIPNYEFWGKTGQFSGSTYSELEGSQDNVSLTWTRGEGSTYANSTAMRFYKDNNLTFTAPEGYEITSIVITFSTTQYAPSDLSFTPGDYSLSETTGTWTGSSSIVTMSRPSNASSYAQISNFTITLAPIGNAVATITTINVPSDFNTDIYQGTTAGTLTATVKDNENNTISGATVTWSSSNTGVATIDVNGAVTLIAVGTTTITASYAGVEDQYRPSTDTYELEVTDSTPIGDLVIDFESATTAYTNWTFTNMTSRLSGEITAHGGTYYGTTGGKETASITTKSKIATPYTLTCYVSKQSNNTTASTWYIQVSSDGTTWTDVASRSASDMNKGEWKEFTANLSSYTNVYVRVYYNGTNAYRNIDDLTLLTTVPSVIAPTFSPAEGLYTSAQNVTISTTTSGATIYYTLDGTDPTTSSSVYSSPINVSSTTTIKAMAVASGNQSSIVSATYTIELPLSTMDQIFAKATEVGSTPTTVHITLGDWVVTGANTSSHTFVSDGTKGFMIYGSNHGFSAGDVLSGTVECKVQLYNGAAEITQLNSTTTGLTVTTGGTATVANIPMANLSGINTGALVSYQNLTCEARVEGEYTNYYLSDGTTEIQAYKTLLDNYADYLEDGKTYNITGVFVLNNSAKRVNPRNAADIEEVFTLPIPAFNSQNGGYRLISSPVATATNPTNPVNVTNMIDNTPADGKYPYDLYRFDQAEELEWRNYRNNDGGHFNLEVGKGYLYGNLSEVELVFTGTAITSGTQNVTLDYTEGAEFAGWNLVGNPFGVEAYIDRPFYRMNTSGQINGTTETGRIGVMEGVFVIATSNEEQMPFSTQPIVKKGSTLALNLNSSHTVLDRAIVRFDEGQQLPKFQLNKNHTKVYFTMDGKDYAIVRSEEIGEMPVNFKAEDNGTYNLSLSSENVEFSYLHLIDNKTGNDVDLLQTPSYSFEAKTTDYESRFKLVFATGDNSNDNTFAFYSNGSFVINNEGNATLQVIDITGRIVKSESVNGCANVNVNAAPGVYMLRLINGDNVKVQKVVVK